MTRKQMAFFAVLEIVLCLTTLALAAAPAEDKKIRVSVSQFVQHPALDALLRGFMEQLKKENMSVQYMVHIAAGDLNENQAIAERIAAENPDLVLAIATPSAQACFRAIKNIPILFSAVTDPVGAGLVESLEKPGERITGMTDMSPVDRQIAIILSLQPDLKRLGVLYNPREDNSASIVKIVKAECQKRKISVTTAHALSKADVLSAAQKLVGQCEAVYVPTDNTVVSNLEAAVRLFGDNGLPLYSADVDSVPRGALVALAIDYYKMGVQSARMARRILQGRAPATMPIETLEELTIQLNVKAAERMHIVFPVDLLQAADVIYNSFPD